MRILVISCIHNDIENLLKFYDKLVELKFDVIVSTGDFTDAEIKGFDRTEIGKIIVEELKLFGKPLLVVPGSWDKELIGLFEDEGISIHGIGKEINDIGFYGFGGAKTPFNLPYEPTEEEIFNGLNKGYKMVENCRRKVQVTHAPPLNSKVDIIFSGAHVGSEAVRRFIEEKQPDVAICAHIHEARGLDSIGKTKIINSGRFPEGYCGLVDLNGKVKTEIINLT